VAAAEDVHEQIGDPTTRIEFGSKERQLHAVPGARDYEVDVLHRAIGEPDPVQQDLEYLTAWLIQPGQE
jgi:hypothetical protein